MAKKESDNPNELELKGKQSAKAQDDATKLENSKLASRGSCGAPIFVISEEAGERSPTVSQGASGGSNVTPMPNPEEAHSRIQENRTN